MTVECKLRVRDLLAMKYAIGEITFLSLRFGISLRPGTPEPRTAAESRTKLVMKYAIGKNCFHVLSTRAFGSCAAREPLARELSQARAEGPRSKLAMKDSID
jgi:hypothetical protein